MLGLESFQSTVAVRKPVRSPFVAFVFGPEMTPLTFQVSVPPPRLFGSTWEAVKVVVPWATIEVGPESKKTA